MSDRLSPVTPGDILKEEFMEPNGISASRLARDLDVPANRISEIVAGRRAITADTALRLGVYFGIEPEFWLNLQNDYDLRLARAAAGETIAQRVRPLQAA